MLKHVLLPEKIKNYFFFKKRVLCLEINQAHVQGTLFVYNGSSVSIEKSEGIFLSDFSDQAVESCLKKLASSMKYDEVVTTLSSSSIVFKELELPFIGKEKIGMIIGFEVEPYLPFSYQDAVLDFIVINEDTKNSTSKVLVAAARKTDVNHVTQYFTKAQLSVGQISIDLFAFYSLYQSVLYKSGRKVAEMFINIGLEATTIAYFNKGILDGVRTIPLGISSIAQKISASSNTSYYDVIQDMLQGDLSDEHSSIISAELDPFIAQFKMSMKYFEKSSAAYQDPHHLYVYGIGSCIHSIAELIQDKMTIVVSTLDVKKILQSCSVKIKSKLQVSYCYSSGLLLGASIARDNDTNFLTDQKSNESSRLFIRQFAVLCLFTLGSLGILYWNISSKISTLKTSYNASKRQMVRTIEDTMGMQLQSKKSPKTIVTSVQDTFQKRERFMVLSFSAIIFRVFEKIK